MEEQCYICYNGESSEKPFAVDPCDCKGSIKIHNDCLNNIISRSPNCSICLKPWFRPKIYRNGLEVITKFKSIEELEQGGFEDEEDIYEHYHNYKEEYTLDSLGRKQGLYRSWYKNGQLGSEVTCIDGKPHGYYKLWHNNGALCKKYMIYNGTKNGIVPYWTKDGNMIEIEYYVNGKCEGMYQRMSDDRVTMRIWENGNFKVINHTPDIQ